MDCRPVQRYGVVLVTAVLVWRLIAAWRRDRTLEKKSVDVARAGHDVRQRLTPNHLTDSRTAAVEVRNRCAANLFKNEPAYSHHVTSEYCRIRSPVGYQQLRLADSRLPCRLEKSRSPVRFRTSFQQRVDSRRRQAQHGAPGGTGGV